MKKKELTPIFCNLCDFCSFCHFAKKSMSESGKVDRIGIEEMHRRTDTQLEGSDLIGSMHDRVCLKGQKWLR